MDSNTPKPSKPSKPSKPAQHKKHKKLTIKETKLAEGKARGLTHIQAYKEAGYSTGVSGIEATENEVARANTHKTLTKPHVKDALEKALIKHGITLDTSIAPIGKALNAVKQNEYTGEVTEDIPTQLKGSDRALKLMGVGQDKDGPSVHFHAHIEAQREKYGL